MEDVVTQPERPEATRYAAELDAEGRLTSADLLLTARCRACRTRVGLVFATDHGQLWVGLLGSHRDGRAMHSQVIRRAGRESDGRTIVGVWIEDWRTYYMCDCKCPRNSADGRTVHAALMARRKSVEVPPQK